jgi:hypothetical protein
MAADGAASVRTTAASGVESATMSARDAVDGSSTGTRVP